MARRLLQVVVPCLFLTSLLGCGGSSGQQEATAAPEPPKPKVLLAELLREPRADLAKRGDEALAEIRTREDGRKKNRLEFTVLPKWAQPVMTPGFQDLKYNKDLGLSLPGYADGKDPNALRDLAHRYAELGDSEAAAKLGITPSTETDAKSFSIEWSRFVALYFHGLQQRIALGDAEALGEFLEARKQLDSLFDDKTKQGPLGQNLLVRGRRTLQLAVDPWRKMGQTPQADSAEEALKSWPKLTFALPQQAPPEGWAKHLKGTAHGKVVVCQPAGRALDLLGLPFPAEAVEAVLLFLNGEQLEEIIVAYNARVQDPFPRPMDFGAWLTERVTPTAETVNSVSYQPAPGLTAEVHYPPFDATIGAWVRLTYDKTPTEQPVPRQLGGANLDWTFEHNRLTLAPSALGSPLVLKDQTQQLAKVENPLPDGKVQDVTVNQVDGFDLVQDVTYRYRSGTPWHQAVVPLFARLGPAKWKIEARERGHGGHVNLTWDDPNTNLTFAVPHEGREPMILQLRDLRDKDKVGERQKAVAVQEATERQERIRADKPEQRLPRRLEYVPLGMDRVDVLKYLPRGQTVIKRELPDGLLLVNNMPPPKDAVPYLARQIVVRFNAENKVSWVRFRYEMASKPKNNADWTQTILGPWLKAGGTVTPLPSPLIARSTDLPQQLPPGIIYQWIDDVTSVSCLLTRDGVEVTLRDRPLDKDDNEATFTYLPRGVPAEVVPGLELGTTRSQLEAALQQTKTVESEGALVISPATGPYDAVLVWFDKDQVRQIAGRFRQQKNPQTAPKDLEKALTLQWGSEIKTAGWPTRRDYSPQGNLQALTWFDDFLRYRVYWADSDNSPARLWCEWQTQPAK